jgi:signal transduction histidine kinase
VNVSFERRALLFSTISIAGTLTVLVAALALALYWVYVRSLGTQMNDSLDEVRAYVAAHGAPQQAEVLADGIASRFIHPQLVVYVLDPSRRAEIRWNRPTGSVPPSATIAMSDRTHVKISSPNGLAAQLLVGLGTLFGLAPVQVSFGTISVIVRSSDDALVAAVKPFAPWFVVAELAALAFGFALARLLTREALRPLADVTAALERFASGDLTPQPVPTDARNRLDSLALAYNAAIEQVARAFAERERAQAGMRQFIADAGHQLRTPLTVIRGFTAILRQGDLRETRDQQRILDAINRQSLVMGSLIDKLILLERWEGPDDPSPPEAIDVVQLIEDTVSPIGEAHSERVRLHAGHAGYVSIDPSDLAEALTNLADNALKYTEGPVDVRVSEANGRIYIEVADQGPGMTAEEARHAFDRFYRGANRREIEGSGLGLSIARRAIERAGGSLTVVSSPDGGSRFTIGLPVAPGRRRRAEPRLPAGV